MPSNPRSPDLFSDNEKEVALKKFMDEHKVINPSDVTLAPDGSYLIKGLTAHEWDNLWEKDDSSRYND